MYLLNTAANENGITNVFQTYHALDLDGTDEKGINSYQLVYFEDRWWIHSILWTGNGNGVELPAKDLGK